MKPTLVILAAGMGSRYGGLKQLDELGPGGQTIMDYSVHDAIEAGFKKVVFVIRKDFETEFKERVLSKYEEKIHCEMVFQEMDAFVRNLDPQIVESRLKPWGTAHAILVTKNVINEPFAAINADDFYGKESFLDMARFLNTLGDTKGKYSMVGYRLKNTLSENGTVNRGICMVDGKNMLKDIFEGLKIGHNDAGQLVHRTNELDESLEEDTLVSMNFWGFHQSIFDYLEKDFIRFIGETTDNPKSEYFIPFVVNDMMKKGMVEVEVLPTQATWKGVTYQEDRQKVVDALSTLTDEGVYPKEF